MQWEKKICIRLTTRRIIGAILTATTVVNMVIVGAVFEAAAPISTPTLASVLTVPPSTTAFFIPPSTAEAVIPFAWTETLDTTPTQLFTPTDTPISPPGWILCIKKFYWSDYRVQPGDTLYSLATASGSTVEELVLANCLPDDRIYYGQLLYVPRPLVKTFTSTSSATATDTLTATSTTTDTATSTSTPTYIPTATLTHTATNTSSATSTDTLTPTLIYTATPTPTNTPDITLTIGPGIQPSVGPVVGWHFPSIPFLQGISR